MEEKRRSTLEKAWIYNTHAKEVQEIVAMKAKLRIAKKSINNLKNMLMGVNRKSGISLASY